MIPEESYVRLFVSVDLVGSTAYKNGTENAQDGSKYGSGPPWADVFKNFYNGFPKWFERPLDGYLSLEPEIRPRLVKTIGDELLLQAMIRTHHDARNIIRFLSAALPAYTNTNLSDKPLLLKATAWVAGFPINNFEVPFEEEGGKSGGGDYIGPSIDTGFRIAKMATPSKLVVSVDLALLLLQGQDALDLHFEGTENLKGVLGGKPYPILWFTVAGRDSELLRAELDLRRDRPTKDALQRYCEKYIDSCEGTWLIRPYLREDAAFQGIPSWHQKVIEASRRLDRRYDQVLPSDVDDVLVSFGSGGGATEP